MDEKKIKTGPLRFPAKENPNIIPNTLISYPNIIPKQNVDVFLSIRELNWLVRFSYDLEKWFW